MATKKQPKKANQSQSSLESRLKKLEIENSKLKHKLEQSQQVSKPRSYHKLRVTGTIFFVTLALLSFVLFNVSSWVKQTVLDTETFVKTMQPLISQPAIQKTMQVQITDALFEKVNVEQELQNALPANIAFLSGPLASQIESFTSSKVAEVIASPQVYAIWGTALRTIHGQALAYVENENNDGIISVNDVYAAVSGEISQDSRLAFLTNKQLPSKIGSITLAQVTWLPQVRQYIAMLNITPIIFLIISLVSSGVAVALALHKRRVAVTIAVLISLFMLVTVASISVAIWRAGQLAQPEYKDAIQAVMTTLTTPLENRTYGYAALFGTIAVIGVVTSKLSGLVRLRKNIDDKLVDWAKLVLPKHVKNPVWLTSFSDHVGVISWTTFSILFLLVGVRIPPEYSQVKNGLILALLVVSILYVAHIVSRAFQKTDSK